MSTDIQLPAVSLTPWRMFLTADVVVQSVMVMLLIASAVTWTILVVKCLEVFAAKRRLAAGLQTARGASGLEGLRHAGGSPLAASFAGAAITEIDASQGLPADGIKQRAELALHRLEHGLARRLAYGTGLLASIGSCGPFVGLFGTVWGIMNSFVGISQAHTSSLAVVAPGIAEALLATACGLVAAIPAVLTYNFLARLLGGYRAALGDLTATVLAHASRDIDRRQSGLAPPPRLRPIALPAAAE
jgi:biopolymer transport protein ExbB